jgi:uncharacterized membrane protein
MKLSFKIAAIIIVLSLFALAFYLVSTFVDTANAGFHGGF